MNQKPNFKKAFIQIPVLVVIFFSTVIISGIGYGTYDYYKTSKILKESEQLAKEEKYNEAIKKLEIAQNKLVGKLLFKQKVEIELEKNKKLLEDKTEYTQAIEEFEKGDLEKAKELLLKVSENSPYYQEAKNKLEEIYKKTIETQISEAIRKIEEKNKSETESLRREGEKLTEKILELEKQLQQKSPSYANQITEQEIEEILPYVGRITCVTQDEYGKNFITFGSVTFWGPLLNQKNVILTNAHLLFGKHLLHCISYFDFKISSEIYPWFLSKPSDIIAKRENTNLDFIFFYAPYATSKFKKEGQIGDISAPPFESKIPSLPPCQKKMPLGSPVVIIGYPIGATSEISLGEESFPIMNKTVTTGVVSAHDENPLFNGFSDVNYFVSAKIDKGNSGGLALSKINNQLCILGVPTWVEKGVFENMGIVQSLNNIFEFK